MQKTKKKYKRTEILFFRYTHYANAKRHRFEKNQVLDAAERYVGNFFVTKYMKIIKQTI